MKKISTFSFFPFTLREETFEEETFAEETFAILRILAKIAEVYSREKCLSRSFAKVYLCEKY